VSVLCSLYEDFSVTEKTDYSRLYNGFIRCL